MHEPAETAAPFVFQAPLTVCMDVRHPLAYLALGPTLALADELAIAVDWLPFPVSPSKAVSAAGDDRGARHRRARAAYQAHEIAVYAQAQGLVIEAPFRDGDATPAALAHLWLRGQQPDLLPAFLRRLFASYWNGSLDAGDAQAMSGLIGALGLDAGAAADFAAGPGPDALAELRAALVAAGVFTVPSLIVEGEVFVGRAHLPMVRWLLTGRHGPPPV